MQTSNQDSITLDLIGISGSYQGGASIFARTLLAEFMKDTKNKYCIILPENEKENYIEFQLPATKNITFHYFKSRDNLLLRVLFRLATRVFKSHALLASVQRHRWKDCIEFIEKSSYSCLTLSTYINFPLNGVKHYCTLHDIQEKALPQFFSSKEKAIRNVQVLNTLSNVTGLQVSSKFVCDEIKKYYPKESQIIDFRVIPEGFSSLEFDVVPPLKNARLGPVRIIFPANYWLHKDHQTFFKTLALIDRELKLEVFCTGSTFQREKEISQLLAELKLDNVRFTGYLTRPELMKLYQSSHIVISCSMYESSSLPILEGAVLGCIPVASDIAPHREMAERFNIYLFEVGNISDLYRVLTGVIINFTHDKTFKIFDNSVLVRKLSWEALMPKYLEFLEMDLTLGNRR